MSADTISNKPADSSSHRRMNVSQSTTAEVTVSSATPSPLFSRRSPSDGIGDVAIVPPSHSARTLVLCFGSNSGFGSNYRAPESNLFKFFDLLTDSRYGENQQMRLYYRPDDDGSIYREYGLPANILPDKDFAVGLDYDVVHAYRDLVYDYRPGDKISLFGFSRGAYTARALAEMIHKVGLLPKDQSRWVRHAYSLYLRDVDDRWHTLFERFQQKYNPIKVDIDFVGVWDTLSSVLGPRYFPRTLPFTRSNTSIRVFRQALALHDCWARLHPKFYEFDTQNVEDHTDVQEVWFAGSHRDVGGCTASKDTPHALGRISLRWMVRECFRMNTGILFKAEKLRKIGLDPASLYPVVKERPRPLQPRYFHLTTVAPRVPMASEEEHDVRDALTPMHDQLTVYSPLWWVTEFWPICQAFPIAPASECDDGSEMTVRMPWPRGLFIPKQHSRFYVHPSVYTRQQAEHLRKERSGWRDEVSRWMKLVARARVGVVRWEAEEKNWYRSLRILDF